ncbi:hypothetical protein ACFE04_031913 [Oxalis oulophora]
MKILSMQRWKRIQFMRWGSKIDDHEEEKRRAPLMMMMMVKSCCCKGSSVGLVWIKKMLYKLKFKWRNRNTSSWKIWKRKKKNNSDYSYDIHSYELNFDDGGGEVDYFLQKNVS